MLELEIIKDYREINEIIAYLKNYLREKDKHHRDKELEMSVKAGTLVSKAAIKKGA